MAFKQGNQAAKGKGRPKAPLAYHLNKPEAFRLTNEDLKRAIDLNLSTSFIELEKKVLNKEERTLDLAIATLLYRGITNADPQRISFILDRRFGKPKESLELEAKIDVTKTVVEKAYGEVKFLLDEAIEHNKQERYKLVK